MRRPELPPHPLDPEYVENTGNTLVGHHQNRRATIARDPDALRQEAAGLALRDARVQLWRDLWTRVETCDRQQAEIAALRIEIEAVRDLNRQLVIELNRPRRRGRKPGTTSRLDATRIASTP